MTCEMASASAIRALDRLLSMGVLRLRVSYEKTYGPSPPMQSRSRMKWSRACRKCFPMVEPGRDFDCLVSWSSSVRMSVTRSRACRRTVVDTKTRSASGSRWSWSPDSSGVNVDGGPDMIETVLRWTIYRCVGISTQ